MDKQDVKENKGKLKEDLQTAIDAEHTASVYFKYAASLIKNGKVRATFYNFADLAEKNKGLLLGYLKNAGVNNFVLEDKCKLCQLNPTSFSLLGALNLGLEIINASIRSYSELLDLSGDKEDKELFRRLLKEKNQQRNFLQKERRFARIEKDKSDLLDSYSITEAISHIWE
ncbi:MAG: hypothetical protein NC923_01195 [Candidatus Omnitrophica bacterium]|nr:hypothetical protein [Candidatus Omnitrophota bacterium]